MYQKSELLEKLKIKYKIKKGTKINKELILKILKREKIENKDLLIIFQISRNTWSKLKNNKQNYTILKFNMFPEIKYKEIFKLEKITYKDFINLRDKLKLKDYTLLRILGISTYSYNKMKNDENFKVRIRNMKVKHIVDLIKIDIKYIKKYKTGYYLSEQLEKICKTRKITLDNFLRYYNNFKHYKFNKIVIEKNKKGFWIGKSCRIPTKIFERIENKLRIRLNKFVNRLNIFINSKDTKEDLVQDTLIEIYEKYGDIIKNFYFDKKIMFNIITAKARYFMKNIYRKQYDDKIYFHYDRFEEIEIDHTNILIDNSFNPEILI